MMIRYNKEQAIQEMDRLGREGTPFLFLIDYELDNIIIQTDIADDSLLRFDISGMSNGHAPSGRASSAFLDIFPMTFESYRKGYDQVLREIQLGNSFLLNLTYPTRICTDLTLADIYHGTSARYKVYLKDKFVCFSPEIFVKIRDGKISSHPMKGTIDAAIPGAEQTILSDQKELAEHYTIVDLIRNDLSIVARDVTVERFRYVDHISTDQKDLLQISSEITGRLPDDYCTRIGSILFSLLPAGSISGAPKQKTLQIIADAELGPRGYYTGICGFFDGRDLDSGVMIRYIEQMSDGSLMYRSGCGITAQSDAHSEYREMLDKVYLPMTDKKVSTAEPLHLNTNA